MLVKINGIERTLPPGSSLEQIITNFTKNPDHVVSEVNGHIIKKSFWAQTQVNNGDMIELVSFVGGG